MQGITLTDNNTLNNLAIYNNGYGISIQNNGNNKYYGDNIIAKNTLDIVTN